MDLIKGQMPHQFVSRRRDVRLELKASDHIDVRYQEWKKEPTIVPRPKSSVLVQYDETSLVERDSRS